MEKFDIEIRVGNKQIAQVCVNEDGYSVAVAAKILSAFDNVDAYAKIYNKGKQIGAITNEQILLRNPWKKG